VGSSDEYPRVCPVVFESTARISVLPGFEIRSTVQEIRPVAAVPPGTFEVPPTYERRSGGGQR
jgi:hypothetical protein